MRNPLHFCLRGLICALWLLPAGTTNGTEKQETDLTVWGELRVAVKDESGKPVVGAAVKPYAMRMVERDGHGYWDEKKHGPTKDYLTDQDGMVAVRFPSKIAYGPERWTTKSLTFLVRHSDFVQKVVDFDLDLDAEGRIEQADVALKKGCELQLAAVDENGAQVSDFGVVIAGRYAPDFWADDGNGGRRTSSLSDGTWQTMIVKPQVDGLTLFSGLLPLRVRPSQAVKMRNIKLSPGTRILGTLSDDVPRPVVGGYVTTTSIPMPDGDSYDEKSPSLCWHDSVTVSADGKFELPSVPRSGKIQIIAICDGWVSRTTIPEANNFFVMGQLFDVSGEQVDVTIEMEPTGSIELTLRKPDGSPLDSGTVSSWPNQKYYKGGSTLLGQRANSIKFIQNQLLPIDQQGDQYERTTSFPFTQQPVKNGVAILQGIPIQKSEQCILQHDEFRFPNEANDRDGTFRFTLESANPKTVTINVIPHENVAKVTP